MNTTKPLQHQTLPCLARNARHANKRNTIWTSHMKMTEALQSNNCYVSCGKLVKSKTENTTRTSYTIMTKPLQRNTATSRAENSSCQQKQHHTNKLHEHAEPTAIRKGLHLAQETRHVNRSNAPCPSHLNTTKPLLTQTPALGQCFRGIAAQSFTADACMHACMHACIAH